MKDISNGFSPTLSNAALGNTGLSTKTVFNFVVKRATKEVKHKSVEANKSITEFTVSGDGSWKKEFSCLFGIVSLIGERSKTILDVIVKSNYCKECEVKKSVLNEDEFEDLHETLEENCSANHTGSAGKMKLDEILEMLLKSEERHGVKYVQYVGDGDTKTFKAILNAEPYNDESPIRRRDILWLGNPEEYGVSHRYENAI